MQPSAAPPRPLFTCQDEAGSEVASSSPPPPPVLSHTQQPPALLSPSASPSASVSCGLEGTFLPAASEGEHSASESCWFSFQQPPPLPGPGKPQQSWSRGSEVRGSYLEDRLERALFSTSGVSSDVGTAGDPPNSDLLSLSDAVSPSSLFSDSDSCKLERQRALLGTVQSSTRRSAELY